MQRHEKFAQSVHTVSCKITCESVSGKGGLIMYRAKISPNLKKIFEKGERGEVLTLLLADGRRVKCRLEMLTYANKSDTDDTDVMVARIKYGDGNGELLAEEDIKEVL